MLQLTVYNAWSAPFPGAVRTLTKMFLAVGASWCPPLCARSSTEPCFSSSPLPPPNYASTSHDQPCAVETRGKVAALCRLETGENWQHTNTYTPTDNTMPLLQVKNLQPVVLERTTLTFNSLVSLKADATPFSTDSVYHPSHFQSQRCTWKFCP